MRLLDARVLGGVCRENGEVVSIGKGKQEKRCGNTENNGKNIERLMYGFIECAEGNKGVRLQGDKKNKTA